MGCPAAGYAMGQNARKETAPNPAKTTKNLPRKPGKAGKTQFWGNVQKAAGYAAPDSLATAVSPIELRRASLGSLWLWLWLWHLFICPAVFTTRARKSFRYRFISVCH